MIALKKNNKIYYSDGACNKVFQSEETYRAFIQAKAKRERITQLAEELSEELARIGIRLASISLAHQAFDIKYRGDTIRIQDARKSIKRRQQKKKNT